MLYNFVLCFMLLVCAVRGDVVSPSHNYNVTLPEPNAPYVAGQMLPISYTLPDDTNLPNLLSLSITFSAQNPTANSSDIVITSNADISQGFSFRRTHNTYVYYEHQLSYSIPNNTNPGNYMVVFTDAISKTNTSVPILVRPYAAPITSLTPNSNNRGARPSGGGSIFAMHNSADSVNGSWVASIVMAFCIILMSNMS